MSDTGSKDRLLLDAAYEWERQRPDQVYLTQPSGGGQVVDYTWAEALDEARRMAAYLRSLKLPEQSHIALISQNCAHFIICDLAIWMAGHVSVALYPTLNADTVGWILDHSEARLLFIGKLTNWDDMKAGVPAELPKIALPLAPPTDYDKWDDVIAAQTPIEDNPSPPADELALICYTSGTTGRPKGVMHTFASASLPARRTVEAYHLNDQDRCLSYLPLAHVMERCLVECASLYSGTHVYFGENLGTFLQDLRRARPTVFISVPRLWLKFQLGVFEKLPEKRLDTLLKLPLVRTLIRKRLLDGLGLGDVRLAGSGSAPIPAQLIEWYDRLGLTILEGYGMSEDFAYSHMSTPERRGPGFVGVAWDDVKTLISDEGEVLIRSPGNMVGYYKDPEKTAECYTEDGFFKTGDIGEYTNDGLLRITGRTKELFKTSKGKYVAPAPIENLLGADHLVEMCCVSGSGRPACYGLLQLAEAMRAQIADPSFREAITPQLAALLARVNEQVEAYEKMQFLAVVEEEWQVEGGFLTPTLKIKRNVIEDRYSAHLDDWYGTGEPVIWHLR